MMLEWEIYTGKNCSWPIYRYFAVAWFQAKGATNVLLGLSSTVHVRWWDSDVKSTFLTVRLDVRLEWLRNMVTPPLIPVSLLQSNYSCYALTRLVTTSDFASLTLIFVLTMFWLLSVNKLWFYWIQMFTRAAQSGSWMQIAHLLGRSNTCFCNSKPSHSCSVSFCHFTYCLSASATSVSLWKPPRSHRLTHSTVSSTNICMLMLVSARCSN